MQVTRWGVLIFASLVVSAVSHAHALEKQKAGSQAASGKIRDEVLRTAEAKLQQGDEAAIRQGFSTLTEMGGDAAAEVMVARLRRGLPPQLIEAAIDDLVLLNRPVVGAALLELTQHRRIQIRIKAMQAIAALKQRSAQAALLYALDDPSSEVRTAAVEALASVGNARALPALLTAADRDVPGAWAAIGSLASKADLKSLFERAPEGDLRLIRPALDAMIARKDLPLESRVKMVQQVAVLGSVSARAWVADWLANIAATDPPRLRQALADGLARIDRDNALPKGFVAVNSARDPKVAKAAVGIPATTPNAEKRAAKLASPKSAVSAAPQGAK